MRSTLGASCLGLSAAGIGSVASDWLRGISTERHDEHDDFSTDNGSVAIAAPHHHRATWRHRSTRLENTSHDDRLLVLRHVCLEAHKIHFFGNDSAAAAFSKRQEPYRVWQSNAIPRRPPPIWQFSVVNHSGSMAAANDLPTVRRWIGETSFLQVPHKAIDNFFHFHNNFLVPLMLNVLLSGSESVPRRLFLFKTWPPEFQVESKSAARFGLSGLPRTKKTGEWPFNATHPSFFYTLHKLFAEVKWPVDELWEDGQALCFRRLVWSQMLTPSRYPYFDYAPTEQLYRRHSVPNRVRDMIRSAIGLRAPPPRDTLSLTWISRQATCGEANGIGRCVHNLKEVIGTLRASGHFGTVRVHDDFAKHSEPALRDMQLRRLLKLLQETDVLIGVHGAGMGHIIYLNALSAVVELRDHFWYEQHTILIYKAMARLQGCGYLSADVRRLPHTSTGYVLNSTKAAKLARGAAAVWNRTQTKGSDVGCRTVSGRMVRCFEHTLVL